MKNLNLVPGKSLGNIYIGQTFEEVKKLGYKPDQFRSPSEFLTHRKILVRFEKNVVVQIFYQSSDLSKLSLNQIAFPKKNDLKTLTLFLKNCEELNSSSDYKGGRIFYCENSGVELVFDMKNNFDGIAVVASDLVNKMKGK